MITIVALSLSIWGAGLSTLLGAVELLDRRRAHLRDVRVEKHLFYRPKGAGQPEVGIHIECTNFSERPVSLKRWILEDSVGNQLTGSPYEGSNSVHLLQPDQLHGWQIEPDWLAGLWPPVRVLVELTRGEPIDAGTVTWGMD